MIVNDWKMEPQVLSGDQQELLEAILVEEGGEWNAFPLSFAQARLWFLDRLAPGTAIYNIAGALDLSGPLEAPALHAALAAVVERHEILRTTFVTVRGVPLQVIGPAAVPALPLADLSALPAEMRTAEAERLSRAEAGRGFDLETGPLVRATLLRLGALRHRLCLTFHHIVSDGWSSRLFARDLARFYEAALSGLPAELPELPIQYADYSVWQREHLAERAAGARLSTLCARLRGVPALELPTDRPRPPVARFRGARRPVALDRDLVAALAALGVREGVTLFGGLSAVFAAVLSRFSGQADFAVGFPSANRDRAEIEDLIGCFVNTLALRADLAGEPSFRGLLARVRPVLLEAFELQEVPFERVVEELAPERDLSRPPLVQVMLALQSTPLDLRLGDLQIRLLDVDTGTARLDLLLGLAETPAGLAGYVEHDTDLFDRTSVERLLRAFGTLLAGALADPDRRVSELPLLGEAERWQVLGEWNEEAMERPAGGGLLHELFLRQAGRTPEAVALVVDGVETTYAALRRRAASIAARLRRHGVGPETRVGIFLDRGPELIPSLLGTLLAGGAYVPLDPAYPAERLTFLLEDAQAAVVLTRAGLVDRLPQMEVPRLLVEDGEGWEAADGEALPETAADPLNLAYLIYTSGSTGRPKAVAISHASAVALLHWARRVFTPEELSGVVAATTISFDLSVFEIFVPLAWGGTVLLVENALEIARLTDRRARLVNTVPSALTALLRTGGLPAPVRTVSLAGEALPGELVRDLDAAGVERVYNLYGPSEDTTYSTWARIAPGEPFPEIGRPIPGTRAFVLGAGLEPVPAGVPGELYLGGAGLARGYLGRPDLTAERFVPDGLSGEPGARLYRTGDRARQRPDGRLDYLGRIDTQVKVRGFRVELGEVEAALTAMPGIRECAVLTLGEGAERRLAAFFASPAPVDPEALRRHLRTRLPEFMIPSAFVPLESLPLTPNGKLDRKALAGLAMAAERREASAPPRTPTEELVAGIWSEVLGVGNPGREDSFFDLGGHSLIATRVLVRVRETLGVALPVREVFAAPRLADFAARIEELRRAEAGQPLPPLRRVDRGGDLPLSFAQERLWFLDRLTPGEATYNLPLALRLEGALDVEALGRALSEIVRRHEALRTRFAESEGRPVQVIDPPAPVALPRTDLRSLGGEAAAAAMRIARDEARRPFDLAAGPVLRALLVRTGEREHLFALTLHHIAGDGWSLGVLSRELEELYGAFAAGLPSPLPDLKIQYADHAAWERTALAGAALEELTAWWRERLAGAPEVLDLPTDRPRPPVASLRGGRLRALVLPERRRDALRALGRRAGATEFMVLLAGYATLLSRLSRQDDLVIGTPVAGRGHRGVEDLIGLFVNALPLRIGLEHGSFRHLLRAVRETSLDAFAHEELPFEKLVGELAPQRSLSHAPLFQALFVLQSFPLAPPRLPGIESEALAADTGTSRFDLTLALFTAPDGLAAEAEYAAALFDRTTVARLLRSFETLLAGALAEPDRRTGELPLLAEEERWQILGEWSPEAADRPAGGLLHELFLSQSERTPGEVALVVDGRETTYAGLRDRAAAIAARLRRRGVGPETRVGIFLDRGPELVPALLGTLLAGGAYVPVDPAYPAGRIAFMLEDSEAAVVLTRAGLAGRLPEQAPPALLVDEEETEDAAAPMPAADPRNLAYLIYTSGSTGRPKAVAITHASAVALLEWARGLFSPEELAGAVAATSVSFDLSVFEIFAPLAWGGTVLLVENALAAAGLTGGRARLLNTVPSAAAELVRSGTLPASVRTVNLAGEPLPGSLVRDLYAAGVERVYNLYGPSEDTTYSTGARIAPDEPHPEIGRPLPGTRACVLDRGLEPVPAGVPGELYLGGAGLARGYLGRPDLTAERFVPDGLSGERGARLYRTGDLVRQRSDGRLDYLGRLDHQVKIRGFRIELGEIEAALGSHPGVRESLVLAQGSGSGQRLAAFVAGEPATPAELRRHLADRLPEHMVPAVFVLLDALPRTPNGKVDRAALAALQAGEAEPPSAGLEGGVPLTPFQAILAGIWAEVLGVAEPGPSAHFFELGGHSLLAARMVSRVREAFGVDLAVREVFERPRLADLAAQVEELRRPEGVAAAPPIRRVDRAADLPLSFAQERLWLLHQIEGGAAYNMPGVVRLRGELDFPALAASLDEIVRRHEVLRTRFAVRDGHPRQVIDPPVSVALPRIDLGGLPAPARQDEAARLAEAEIRIPCDLAAGPVFRVRLLRLGDAEHQLLFTVHHIAFDGWSLSVLMRELGALYTAAAAGSPSPLPDLAVQYADYAAWQRGWLSGEILEQRLGYWRRALDGAPAHLDLPLDHPRPAAPRFAGGRLRQALPAEAAGRFTETLRRRGATSYMGLLAVFGLLLSRLSGQEDLVVGSPVAERTRTEVEPLIGVFLNTLALRLDLSGDPAFAALLGRVRETTLGAYAHQDLPFERLLAEVRSGREEGRAPLFQVFLNMLSFPRPLASLPGLEMEVLASPELPARFDLTLYAAPGEDGSLVLDLVWNTDLLGAARAAVLLDQIASLVEQAAGAPDAPVGSYSLITPGTLAVLSDPRLPLPAVWEGSVAERVRWWAAETPDTVAVRDAAGATVTWRDLETRSRRIASALAAAGVGQGDVVAVWAHRGAGLPEALLGVWRAGAAFAILDPAYPPARLLSNLRVARPAAWIAVAAAPPVPADLDRWLADAGLRARIDLARQAGDLPGEPGDDPARVNGPDDLAWIAFTSGSTGEPKAILGTHAPLSHFLAWHVETFGLGPADRFSLLSGLAHDPLLRDVFTPLWLGATLCIPDPEEMGTPGRLRAWMAAERITVAHLTPALVQWIADDGGTGRGEGALPALRCAFFGGDLLTRRGAARLASLAPGLLCANFYGATETPQAMGYHVLTAEELGGGGGEGVPVGRGIDGVQLLVLGRGARLAGVGELGEIHVRTPYLSLGYRGDEELTRARFLTNPFTGDPADRLYRTGDLGRHRPDGAVEFAGRADNQLKVRGFRIEPAEVERALELHPRVRRAVAGVHAGSDGERRLVAWIVPAGTLAPSPAELQEWLRERLPAALIPSGFVPLADLPLTPNGKVDRRALPDPVPAEAGGEGDAPSSALEAVLADLWARVLGRPSVGVHDDFFALGGHSLLGARLLARVEEEIGVTLPLRTLFEHPTVAALAPEVERRREDPGASTARLPVAVPDPESRHLPFPLTDIQHAYWVGRSAAVELGNVASHRYLEIEGEELDPDRFAAAWRRLIDRHDMLRAVVRPDGSQVILPAVPPYELAVDDLRGAAAAQVEAHLAGLRARMSHQVLATDRWPLFEIRACRLPGERVRLFFSFDYLIADAWSFRILIRELLALYADPAAALPPLDLSFRDYVMAEQALREGELWRRARAYWDSRRGELPPGPELPLSMAPSALERPRFTRRAARLEPESWSLLRERATAAGVTPSALLLTAFSAVLAAWSKNPRFTIVLTLFNRLPIHPQVDLLVGDFTSTSLLAVDAPPGSPFQERARHLQQRLWDDLDHRYVSGVQVLRELAQGRGPLRAGAPVVFTSTLGLRSLDGGGAEPDLPGDVVFSLAQTPQVLLDHQVSERGGALLWSWDAVDELFPAGLLDDMFAAYARLLARLAEDEQVWAVAPRVVPPEHLALVAAANGTAAPVSDVLLHQLFARRAAEDPERPAVLAPERTLSYGELRARSLDLAHRLRDLGAQPNRLVAIVMEKGWEQVVAALGILEAGAAYLPIDAGLPAERLRQLLAQGEVELAVTQERLDGELAWPAEVRRIAIGAAGPEVSPEPLAAVQGPEDLAYVIFTSGSTGVPKGVMIEHRGAVNTVLDVNQRFAVGPGDRVFALSALSFDLSVWDLFGILAAGGALAFPPADAQRDPAQWVELLDRHRVTVWNSVPALLEMLVDYVELWRRPLPGALRTVLLSGDWIPLSLPARLRALAGAGLELVSLGGATEASIWSILYPVDTVDPAWKSIPYGRPMANQTFYALDEELEPRPAWVPGSLWIGGIGVARGYWHDPEKTAASFVVHPRTGERLYRTGDLGRLLPDGNLEILGREDFQVKVHGYRIEPGEIEAVIGEHPAVRAAVVQAVGDGPGRRLAAWVVPAEGGALPLDEIRSLLRSRLPEYMVPSAFVELGNLPLTANGKVDRQALPEPAAVAAAPTPVAELPPLARRVIGVIAGVLRKDALALDADLFALGASSVEMVRIANLLEIELGFRPRMDELLTLSRVDALVDFYERRLGNNEDLEAAADAAAGAPSFTPLTDPAERERFKASEPGLRRLDGAAAIALSGSEPPSRYAVRRSQRTFAAAPVDAGRLGRWLAGLRRSTLDGRPKYLYASAGGLYPVQVYLYARPDRVTGIPPGAYYYEPNRHELISLTPRNPGTTLRRGDYGWVNQPTFDAAAFALFMIGDLRAIGPIYGPSSRDFCLIESGLMAQLLEERAPLQGLGVCQVGRCRIETLNDLFLLEPGHVFLHSLLGGVLPGAPAAVEEADEDGITTWEEGEL